MHEILVDFETSTFLSNIDSYFATKVVIIFHNNKIFIIIFLKGIERHDNGLSKLPHSYPSCLQCPIP